MGYYNKNIILFTPESSRFTKTTYIWGCSTLLIRDFYFLLQSLISWYTTPCITSMVYTILYQWLPVLILKYRSSQILKTKCRFSYGCNSVYGTTLKRTSWLILATKEQCIVINFFWTNILSAISYVLYVISLIEIKSLRGSRNKQKNL